MRKNYNSIMKVNEVPAYPPGRRSVRSERSVKGHKVSQI